MSYNPNSGGGTGSVYTPTAANNVNLSSNPTVTEAQYIQVGNTVTVSGQFTAEPTVIATLTSFSLTLPIASNFGSVDDAAGTAVSAGLSGLSGQVIANIAGDYVTIKWISLGISPQTWSYLFTYQVI